MLFANRLPRGNKKAAVLSVDLQVTRSGGTQFRGIPGRMKPLPRRYW